jgi:hypothetical protein
MKIIIESTSNGAFVRYDDGENESKYIYKYEKNNLDGLRDLFYDLSEELNADGRYDRFRLTMSIKHGDKYECKGCEWCEGGEAYE